MNARPGSRPRLSLSAAEHEALRSRAAARGMELRREEEPISFADYTDDPTTKRQMFWLSHMTRMVAAGEGRKILDIGSNLPWLIGLAAGNDLTVADVRDHPLKRLFPFRLDQANATALPYLDDSFDVVTFPQVLHWVGTGTYGDPVDIDGDLQAIAEVARVLKPGGLAAFATFVVPGPTVMKLEGRRLFALADLRAMLTAAGFESIELRIFDPACDEISEQDLPQISGRVLTQGNPDEDLAWAVGCARIRK